MAQFQNNFTEMFLGWPAIKIAKMVPLGLTKHSTHRDPAHYETVKSRAPHAISQPEQKLEKNF